MRTEEEAAKLKLDKAAMRVVLEQPFFATLLMNLKRIPDPGCKAIWVDGIHIGYDAEFVHKIAPGDVRSAQLDTLVGVLVHEVYHVLALHHLRIQDMPDANLANRACDLAVNHLIKKAGFKLPDEALDDPRFHNMPVESIYKVLVKEAKPSGGGGSGDNKNNQPQSQGGASTAQSSQQQTPNAGQGQCPNSGGCGCVKPMPSPSGQQKITAEERRQAEQDQVMRNQMAADIAKEAGKLPGDIERVVDEQATQEVDWKDVLSRYVDEHMSTNDYSWSRPNRRYASSGFYLPALRSPEMGTICLALDTSGSISEEALRKMVGECLDCLEVYVEQGQEPQIPVVYCDSAVQRIEVLSYGDKPQPRGGGGTDFAPVFREVKRIEDTCNLRAVVYMTDGYCDSFGAPPDIPVLWILNGDGSGYNTNFHPPFGEVAIMKGAAA